MATNRPVGPAQSIVKLCLLASSALPLWGKPLWLIGSQDSYSRLGASNFAALFHIDLQGHASPYNKVSRDSPRFWWMMGVIIFLVLLGGCFAGLTLGLMGLDMLNLRVLSTSGTVKEQVQAQKVLKLLERGRHWVLVVLLLSNVVVNETLPIFLDTVLGGGAAAILISTALIVIFGEIIPQSICVRYGLSIGAKSAPFVLALMYLEFPIAYPIALLLDYILGHDEGTTYRKAELKTFVGLHRHIGTDGLNEDEVTIISAVLDLSEKTIVDIMTPIEDTFTLGEDSILDEVTVTELVSQGYSRVPVHEAGQSRNFIGMLLVKHLISYDPEDAKPVSDFQLSPLPEGSPDMTCLEALNFFQQGRSHMMLVSSQPGENGGALGVVSLEDVIEEMIGEEIIDETDQYVDVAHKIKVVRRPLTIRSSTRGLAPLIKGVIEKHRYTTEATVPRSSVDSTDGSQNGDSNCLISNRYNGFASAYASQRNSDINSSTQPLRKPRALDKIKVKPGDTSRSQSRVRNHTRESSIQEESSNLISEAGDNVGENTPLLNGKNHESEVLIPHIES
ncbi:hypothetical protein BY996DRAFT_4584623 [Phakopsora pachyrhizi]|uniref:DUF21-domain-containing protein n=1 Tax=Phakopsora pachyrhizi TaxID=170000 RepID=A0AAV0B6N4_PHAPC|nr:hypothetical protein BY996DRAFT_4584623 [Phakopsora pachyrhizi]CAH7682552.1 hypothetical protein PPACK8108_LOCUS15510 [Phakopsora pachyrhizi]